MHISPSRQEKDEINERVKELTKLIDDSNTKQDIVFGKEHRRILPEVMTWYAELRRLRRQRDGTT